jgi:hypothetical protein
MSGSARKTRSKFWVLRSGRGVARTHGRGDSKGGYTWAILYKPMFAHLLPCHRWSNGQHRGLVCRRTEVRISAKSQKNSIQSRKEKFWNFKMGIASVTAISCSHMLHYSAGPLIEPACARFGNNIFRDIMVTGVLNSPRISAGLSSPIGFRK